MGKFVLGDKSRRLSLALALYVLPGAIVGALVGGGAPGLPIYEILTGGEIRHWSTLSFTQGMAEFLARIYFVWTPALIVAVWTFRGDDALHLRFRDVYLSRGAFMTTLTIFAFGYAFLMSIQIPFSLIEVWGPLGEGFEKFWPDVTTSFAAVRYSIILQGALIVLTGLPVLYVAARLSRRAVPVVTGGLETALSRPWPCLTLTLCFAVLLFAWQVRWVLLYMGLPLPSVVSDIIAQGPDVLVAFAIGLAVAWAWRRGKDGDVGATTGG